MILTVFIHHLWACQPHNNQLPVGLIARLVEHSTSIDPRGQGSTHCNSQVIFKPFLLLLKLHKKLRESYTLVSLTYEHSGATTKNSHVSQRFQVPHLKAAKVKSNDQNACLPYVFNSCHKYLS